MSSPIYPNNDSPCLSKPHLSGFYPRLLTSASIFVLHEPFAFQTAIGAALVLGGVALTQRATAA